MYGHDDTMREMIIDDYRSDVEKLLKYLPWLAKQKEKKVSSMYTGEGDKQTIPIPVYDSTLLAFVKEIEKTKFCDKNYPYVYSRNNIKNHDDEIRLMKSAKIGDMKLFQGILSKYALGGKSKAVLWSEGVESGIFLAALECLNVLFFTNTKDGSQMLRY